MGFLDNTRQNFLELKQQSVALGEPISFTFKKVGYGARLFLRVEGTMTLTAADAAIAMKDEHDNRPFALFREIRISVNDGFKPVIASGQLLSALNIVSTPGAAYDVPAASLVPAVSGNPVYQFATVASSGGTANTWAFTLEVPLQINDLDPVGLLLLQNDKVEITVDIDVESASNLFTLTSGETAAFSGTVYPLIEFFSVPQDPKDRPPAGFAHRLIEEKVAIDSTGDAVVALKGGATYLRTISRVILNAAPAGFTDIEKLQLAYNASSFPYDITYKSMLMMQRRRYGRDLPKGVHAWDWMYNGIPSYGTSRDWVNTATISDFEQIIRVAGSATLGGNNNYVKILREILVPVRSA